MKGAPLALVILTANTVHRRSEVGVVVVVGVEIITDQSFFDSPLFKVWGTFYKNPAPP